MKVTIKGDPTRTTDAVRLCPFCDMPPEVRRESDVDLAKCQNPDCFLGPSSRWMPLTAWNRRPGETHFRRKAQAAAREVKAVEKLLVDCGKDYHDLDVERRELEKNLAVAHDRILIESNAGAEWERRADRLAAIAEARRQRLKGISKISYRIFALTLLSNVVRGIRGPESRQCSDVADLWPYLTRSSGTKGRPCQIIMDDLDAYPVGGVK